MRHGEAMTDQGDGDRSRHLTDRGQRNAASMAQLLIEREINVDAILHSGATRCIMTVAAVDEVFARSGVHATHKRIEPFYLASASTLLGGVVEWLRTADDRTDSPVVMIVAHNPGLSQLSSLLVERDDHLTPASIRVFEHDGDVDVLSSLPERDWRMTESLDC